MKLVEKILLESGVKIKFSDKYSGKEIFANGESVGYIYCLDEKTTKDNFLQKFENDKEIVKFFEKNKIPDKFIASEITTVKIDKEYRGQGYGRAAFEKLTKNNSVMYLEVGKEQKEMKYKDRLQFYTNLGFTMFKIKGHSLLIALKYTP